MIDHNKNEMFVGAAFLALTLILIFFEDNVNSVLFTIIKEKSEYKLGEQLSKYYLFIVVLIALHSYRVLEQASMVKLSICYVFLAIIMYLAESNMIMGKIQPIFGFTGMGLVAFYLLKVKNWTALLSFFIGFGLVCYGSATDLVKENETVSSLTPGFAKTILNIFPEEKMDVWGATFILLSAILVYFEYIKEIYHTHKYELFFVLVLSGLVTSGNGLLHYQNDPSPNLYNGALTMMLIGFAFFATFYRRILKLKESKSDIETRNLFISVMFLIFCVLPATFSHLKMATGLLLFLPSLTFFCVYLYINHSSYVKNKA